MNTSVLPYALEEKVYFLSQSTPYPKPTKQVVTKETHMSWVFLTDRHVYKLKKPVKYDFLDYSTLSARRFYCKEEVRLNRRLAEPVYLGTVPLTVNGSAWLQLGGKGTVIDWLVKMQRLPNENMLDEAIRVVRPDGALTNDDGFRG
ncbi:MAG: hypothetical protein WA960_05190 [Tunicatimonas sp.]